MLFSLHLLLLMADQNPFLLRARPPFDQPELLLRPKHIVEFETNRFAVWLVEHCLFLPD